MAKFVALTALVASALLSDAAEVAASPISKVIEMLNGMETKGKEERQAEEVQFAAYQVWCDAEVASQTRAVKLAAQELELLKADIATNEAAEKMVDMKMEELAENSEKWAKEEADATASRKTDKEAYEVLHKDYEKSEAAIDEAIKTLKEGSGSVLSLLGGMEALPAQKVSAFLSQYSALTLEEPEAPKTKTGVLSMLGKLKDKFRDERAEIEKKELRAANDHELLVVQLKASIKEATEAKSKKVAEKSKAGETAAEKKGQVADLESKKKEDEKYASEVQSTCSEKASDFSERKKLRNDELEAISEAVKLLGGESVTATAARAALTQTKASVLAMLRVRAAGISPQQLKASKYLQTMALKFNSRVLSSAAVRAGEDPIEKVKGKIETLIKKLENDNGIDSDHKAYCDKELATNEKTRTAAASNVEDLKSSLDASTAEIAKLESEITELLTQLADNAKSVDTQTKTRDAERKLNKQTISDAKFAQEAITAAVTSLREFYDKASASTALAQTKSKISKKKDSSKAPPIFDAAYKAQDQKSVIGLLETILSDYSQLETSTDAAESSAQKDFEAVMAEGQKLKATMQKDLEDNKRQKDEEVRSKAIMQTDIATAEKELKATNLFYDKLKDSCLDTGSTATEREERVKNEIKSLKEALEILDKQ
eukprot:TRINITY_DN112270_c0_g1_i1.p1 TRINITY_DN112270_c0_g1~~TRINITY_DN112270_c0_g1_i1.p1  ORF type:complete len:694 (-),score=228.41 TRINITY_DN112270_c0_g1_i1:116-2092(-)